jgi:hypothetical protein
VTALDTHISTPNNDDMSNRAVATLILAIMIVMAIVGLVFALNTVAVRRQRDPSTTPRPSPQSRLDTPAGERCTLTTALQMNQLHGKMTA